MPDQSDIKELVETVPEFSRLYDEHQDCERRLDDLHQRSSLSEADELAAKQIKLHKLFLKDRMEEIARANQAAATVA